MKSIVNRYDKCLICDSDLITKHYDGHSLSGSFKKIGDSYLLNYNNKSKIHKVVFDLHLRIIENDGYPDRFFLIKYCDKCSQSKGLVNPPYFTINALKDNAMFYMYYINNKKKESPILLEELFRFSNKNMSYGWHTKFNNKDKIWSTTIVVVDRTKTIDAIFTKTMESNTYNKFNSVEEIEDKLSMLHTFS